MQKAMTKDGLSFSLWLSDCVLPLPPSLLPHAKNKCARSDINRSDMKRVQVWLVNEESSRTVHEHFGQLVEAYIPSREVFFRECEATPEAVAELADVEIEEAAEALARPNELVGVGELYEGDVSAKLYLLVSPK
jgi:hypothetical protein